jgi:nucleotide-binding universal stress UspA family protein
VWSRYLRRYEIRELATIGVFTLVEEAGMFSLGKILLPIDFSELCLDAARHAVPSLAKHFNSEVTVLHVLPPYFEFGIAELGSVLSTDLMAERKAQARRNLDLFLSEELSDVSVKRVYY